MKKLRLGVAALWSAIVFSPPALAVTIYGGPAYDGAASTGYLNPSLPIQPGSSARNGGAKLSEASGVSTEGKTIVGHGTRNGNTEAFVAVLAVPEPMSFSLLAAGAGVMLAASRGRRM